MSVLVKNIPYEFKNPKLLDNRAFIGGEWINASENKTFSVYDPENNGEIAKVADCSKGDVTKAVEAAHRAFKEYKQMPHRERKILMRKWADLVKANRDDLAAICTLELGKPFTESLVTVDYGISFLDWFEGEIERTYGETIPAARKNNRIITIREPQGVVAAITPWNSPIAMVTRKVGAAIAAGNTVVCKPAPETPLCAAAIAKLFEMAGYPPGVLNIIPCSANSAAAAGAELTSNRLVRHVSFTGSTQIGKLLTEQCARTLKRTSMELGGNAPFIVFEDANLDKAVQGLITSKYRSSGQTCVCANRVFVQASIMEEFAAKLRSCIKDTFVQGSVWDRKVNYGPLYSGKAIEKVQRHLQDAMTKGAKLYEGGFINEKLGPNFYVPTVLTNGSPAMKFATEETFGPIAALIPFNTESEVIEMANNSEVGLAGYFYTESISRMWRVSEALETGMVGVGVGLISACEQPFGGVKESGVGREGSRYALDEYLNIKSITVGI